MILTAYQKGSIYEKYLPKLKAFPSIKIIESTSPINRAQVILDNFTEDIIWIEMNAIINMEIPFPAMKENIALFFKSGEMFINTMVFKKNKKTESVLIEWKKAIETSPESPTKLLREILHNGKIAVDLLDERYCCMVSAKICRNPIIQYERIQAPVISTTPKSIGNIRIIKNFDGSVAIARRNGEAEKWLDKNMTRCVNELRWVPRPLVEEKTISDFSIDGQTVYIIGKGPSLSNITKEHFGPHPIFCINESIHMIEKLNLPNKTFVVFQDSGIKFNCIPKNAGMLVSSDISNFFPDKEKYTFNPKDWFQQYNYTPIIAINIAKSKVVKKFIMVGFDSITNGDKSYAKEIGYQSKEINKPDRYKTNVIGIKKALEGCEVEYITPLDASSVEELPTQKDTPAPDANE